MDCAAQAASHEIFSPAHVSKLAENSNTAGAEAREIAVQVELPLYDLVFPKLPCLVLSEAKLYYYEN